MNGKEKNRQLQVTPLKVAIAFGLTVFLYLCMIGIASHLIDKSSEVRNTDRNYWITRE